MDYTEPELFPHDELRSLFLVPDEPEGRRWTISAVWRDTDHELRRERYEALTIVEALDVLDSLTEWARRP